MDGADDYVLAAKGEKLLVRKGKDYTIIEIKEGQNLAKKLNTAASKRSSNPRRVAADLHRRMADGARLLLRPGMHGVNWPGMREQYGRMLEHCVTRWDVKWSRIPYGMRQR